MVEDGVNLRILSYLTCCALLVAEWLGLAGAVVLEERVAGDPGLYCALSVILDSVDLETRDYRGFGAYKLLAAQVVSMQGKIMFLARRLPCSCLDQAKKEIRQSGQTGFFFVATKCNLPRNGGSAVRLALPSTTLRLVNSRIGGPHSALSSIWAQKRVFAERQMKLEATQQTFNRLGYELRICCLEIALKRTLRNTGSWTPFYCGL